MYGRGGVIRMDDWHSQSQVLTETIARQKWGLPKIDAIAAGDHHTFAVIENGQVWAWGHNAYGQMGENRERNR